MENSNRSAALRQHAPEKSATDTSKIPTEIVRAARKLAARVFHPFLASESAALDSAAYVENKGRTSRAATYLTSTTSKAGELARLQDPATKPDDEIGRWLGIRASAITCRDAALSDRMTADDAIERADTMLAVLYLQATGSGAHG